MKIHLKDFEVELQHIRPFSKEYKILPSEVKITSAGYLKQPVRVVDIATGKEYVAGTYVTFRHRESGNSGHGRCVLSYAAMHHFDRKKRGKAFQRAVKDYIKRWVPASPVGGAHHNTAASMLKFRKLRKQWAMELEEAFKNPKLYAPEETTQPVASSK